MNDLIVTEELWQSLRKDSKWEVTVLGGKVQEEAAQEAFEHAYILLTQVMDMLNLSSLGRLLSLRSCRDRAGYIEVSVQSPQRHLNMPRAFQLQIKRRVQHCMNHIASPYPSEVARSES